MSSIDHNKCMSVKSKGSKSQCIYRKQINSEYCGIHKKSKNVVRIDTILTDNQKNIKIKIIDKDKITIQSKVKKIYTVSDIINCPDIEELSVSNLKYTIKTLNTSEFIRMEGDSKRQLYSHLYKYYEKQLHYLQNIPQITKAQSYVRRYLVYKRRKAINDIDCFTLDNKYEIPSKYYFDITDNNGNTYCFDIRTFKKILETSNKPCNPYTMYEFSKNNITKFMKRLDELKKYNIDLNFEQSPMTSEQLFYTKMVDIFHDFNMLDNYTDYRWFANLSLDQLKELYKRAEDIWNYRSQLSHQQKCKIVSSGKAFDIPIHLINKIKTNNKRKLQNIILDEFYRFSHEGINIDEKKLGVMLILTALVEVSYDAACALPHLVQL